MDSKGKRLMVSSSARLYGLEKITVGSDVYIAGDVIVLAGERIFIGDEVMLGVRCTVVSGNHKLYKGSYRFGKSVRSPIFINRGSWIGAHATLTSGADIPESTLIAANSVVSKKLLAKGVYGGVPAKLLKRNYDV